MKGYLIIFSILILAGSFSPSGYADSADESAVQKDVSEGATIEVTPTDQMVALDTENLGPDETAMVQTDTSTVLSEKDEQIVLRASQELEKTRPDLAAKLKAMTD